MEIERKWMVSGWPSSEKAMPLLFTEYQEQGYVHPIPPVVRIRLEARKALPELLTPGPEDSLTDMISRLMTEEDKKYVLCFKSKGLLSRKEIEMDIPPDKFADLKDLIEKPLIRKVRRVYALPDQLELEVNLVDEGLPTQFMYAEVEYVSEEQANVWNPADYGLGEYLSEDVTSLPGQSMSAYWTNTRLQ